MCKTGMFVNMLVTSNETRRDPSKKFLGLRSVARSIELLTEWIDLKSAVLRNHAAKYFDSRKAG